MESLTPFEREDEERYMEEPLPPRIKSKKNLIVCIAISLLTSPIWILAIAIEKLSHGLSLIDESVDNWIGKHFAWEDEAETTSN